MHLASQFRCGRFVYMCHFCRMRAVMPDELMDVLLVHLCDLRR